MSGQIMSMLLSGAVGVFILFFIIWVIHIFLKNAAIVDVGWGLGFILLCTTYVIQGEGFNPRNSMLLLMVVSWGVRIVGFLIRRIARENREDPRYQKFRSTWGKDATWKFLFLFEFQALLEIIIALPFVVVSLNQSPGISAVEVLGALIFAGGLLGETISDQQLQNFKSNPAHKGKTCDVGLWRYSRHPNYFFEWLIWMGLSTYALGSPYGWIGVLSPVVMYILMRYVSGVPLAEEQSLRTRGQEYKRYQQTTSIFFPMPKRT